MKNVSKGFTLIELLVVIAIIGILSAVVLASLSSARSKGNDAAVKGDISGAQTQAELYYLGAGNNSYGTVAYGTSCTGGMFSDTVLAKAIAAANNANGSGNVYCYAAGNTYLIAADLSSGWWCADSNGSGSVVTSPATAPSTIPTGNKCP